MHLELQAQMGFCQLFKERFPAELLRDVLRETNEAFVLTYKQKQANILFLYAPCTAVVRKNWQAGKYSIINTRSVLAR